VRSPEGNVFIDPTGKASGRGAYLCTKRDCWQVALTRGSLEYALKTSIAPKERERLEQFGQSLADEAGDRSDGTALQGKARN